MASLRCLPTTRLKYPGPVSGRADGNDVMTCMSPYGRLWRSQAVTPNNFSVHSPCLAIAPDTLPPARGNCRSPRPYFERTTLSSFDQTSACRQGTMGVDSSLPHMLARHLMTPPHNPAVQSRVATI